MTMRRTVVAAFGATLLAAGTSAGVGYAAGVGNLTNHQTATGGANTAVVSGTVTVTAANSATTSIITHSPTGGANLRNRFTAKNGNNNANNHAGNKTGSQRFTIG
jgi:hypothetical protein